VSYSVRLRASGGSVQVESVIGTVPDGGFTVANISVGRYGVTGPAVVTASATLAKTMPVVTP